MLNAGVIEQVGAPMDLYEHPRNLFVAEFIGSPKMNLIPAELVENLARSATVRTEAGDIVTVAVDASSGKAGDRVTLGVRPEQLGLTEPGSPITAEAVFVETLGNTTFAYLTYSGLAETLTVQLSGTVRPKTGDHLTLHVAADQAHLFGTDGNAFPRP